MNPIKVLTLHAEGLVGLPICLDCELLNVWRPLFLTAGCSSVVTRVQIIL